MLRIRVIASFGPAARSATLLVDGSDGQGAGGFSYHEDMSQ
jgi:hypothetical protein